MALDHEGPYLRIERIEPDADWPAGFRTRLVAYNADGTPDPEGQAVIDRIPDMEEWGRNHMNRLLTIDEATKVTPSMWEWLKNQSKETDHE